MELIGTATIGAGGGIFSFTNIPQTHTDLLVVLSIRSMWASTSDDSLGMYFNGVQTDISNRNLYGSGTGAASTNSTYRAVAAIPSDNNTANTYGSIEIYIANYSGNTHKAVAVTGVTESNTSAANQVICAERWANTAAITSLTFDTGTSGALFKQYSSMSLYGITKGSGGATVTSA